MAFAKDFLLALEEKFGEVSEIRKIGSEGKPEITVFYFNDLPEEGLLTAVTCGLSGANHPDWKNGAPELIVTLKTQDTGWGLAAGYIASAFFGEKKFEYGDLFRLDDPFSDDNAMKTYFVFAPSFLDRDDSRIEVGGRVVHMKGVYPLYDEELELYKQAGLERFWKAEGFDLYETDRPKVFKA